MDINVIINIIERKNKGESIKNILKDKDMPTLLELGKYLLTCPDDIHDKFFYRQ